MNDIETDKKVIRTGGSLALRLTKELAILGVKEGEIVRIRLSKKGE